MKALVTILIALLVFIVVGGIVLYLMGAFGMPYPLEEDPNAPFYWDLSNPTTPTSNSGHYPTLTPAPSE